MDTLVNARHFTNIANAIREKNGSADAYKVSEMAEQINALTEPSTISVICGIGSTVRVMDKDGEVIVSKTATSETMNIPVPCAGEYTVSLMQGNTQLLSQTVNVVNNYNVSFVDPVLDNNTWETIRLYSDSNIASSIWSVGDAKSIIIDGTVGATTFSNLAIDAYIIGFDHNSNVEGNKRIHFKLGMINNVQVALCDSSYNSDTTATGKFTMNTSLENFGGWNASHMRKTVLGSDSSPTSPTANTLLSALPSDLRAVMKSVVKYSDNTGGGSNTASYVTATTDYLPLLAEFEIQGTRSRANSAEQNYQQQYAYYVNGNSKVHYKHNGTTTSCCVWLRSVSSSYGGYFCSVSTDGSANNNNANNSNGVSPAFVV